MPQDNRARRQNQLRLLEGLLAAGATLFVLAAYPSCTAQRDVVRADGTAVAQEYSRLTGILARDSSRTARAEAVETFRRVVDSLGAPVTDDASATFLYFGSATRVRVAGEFNRWDPEADTLTPVKGTPLFFRTLSFQPDARLEYKIVADSAWILDPLNRRTAAGGYGKNSDLRMPAYMDDTVAIARAGVARGSIDTLAFESPLLGRTHPLYVYTPHEPGPGPLPVLYVLDGGEYLEFAHMDRALDNMLADRLIPPLLVVFFDPRTDPRAQWTNKRRIDYVLSDQFLRAMVEELVPFIAARYRVTDSPGRTAIMGASLGGLTATYAVWHNPEVFGVALIQSPAYWWENEKLLGMMTKTPTRGGRFWIETGIYHDAQVVAPKIRDLLRDQGRAVVYTEVSQGHNWTHWRSYVPAALRYFAGTGR